MYSLFLLPIFWRSKSILVAKASTFIYKKYQHRWTDVTVNRKTDNRVLLSYQTEFLRSKTTRNKTVNIIDLSWKRFRVIKSKPTSEKTSNHTKADWCYEERNIEDTLKRHNTNGACLLAEKGFGTWRNDDEENDDDMT